MHFDLISDLHIDFWKANQQLDWSGLSTSLVAVVAGDISRDWETSYNYLVMLAKHYKHVVCVEGNHEHNMQPNISANTVTFQKILHETHNITFLNRNSVVLDSTAFVGANGWWTFDFCEPEMSKEQCWQSLAEAGFDEMFQGEILLNARQDAQHLCKIIEIMDADPQVHSIVIVTHSAPIKSARWKPAEMPWYQMGRAGNSLMLNCLNYNTNKKVCAWCFGHVHTEIDQVIDGVRYVCHPRGIPPLGAEIYFPKMISL